MQIDSGRNRIWARICLIPELGFFFKNIIYIISKKKGEEDKDGHNNDERDPVLGIETATPACFLIGNQTMTSVS